MNCGQSKRNTPNFKFCTLNFEHYSLPLHRFYGYLSACRVQVTELFVKASSVRLLNDKNEQYGKHGSHRRSSECR